MLVLNYYFSNFRLDGSSTRKKVELPITDHVPITKQFPIVSSFLNQIEQILEHLGFRVTYGVLGLMCEYGV
jgi:hypothetical protein